MKKTVKIAYFDISASQTPPMVGEVRGTPTIKFLYPDKKNKPGSNKKKIVSDYQGERKWKDMANYAKSRMPNFTKRVKDAKGFDQFVVTADKYCLPKVLVFTEKSTSHVIKALSTEFRRRAYIAVVKSSSKDLVEKFKVTKFPAIVALKADGSHVIMEKKPSWNRLNNFMVDHALKKIYQKDETAQACIAAKTEGGKKAEL